MVALVGSEGALANPEANRPLITKFKVLAGHTRISASPASSPN